MEILFLYPNINVAKPTWYSYGLSCLVAVLKANGFNNVEVMPIFSEEEYAGVFSRIESIKPKIVGISSVASQFRFVKKLVPEIKNRFPDTVVVCGGVHPTIFPECLRDAPELDGIFRGESEFSFLEFVNRIKENKPCYDVPNFAYLNDSGEIVSNPPSPLIEDLDILPFPDRESFDYEAVQKSTGGRADFIFNRGCPYQCSYCSNHALAATYGLKVMPPRYRSPELAVREIADVLGKYEVTEIFIQDEIFGLNRKWLFEFCALYRKHVKFPFECFQRANFIDKATLTALKDAGCFSVDFGVESGNDFIRNEVMKRKMTEKQIIDAFELCHKLGLKTTASNIIGLPFETKEMIYDTIRLNRRILSHGNVVGVFYPYPGTDLEKLCREKNLINEEKLNDPNFVERKRGSVLNLEISDDELNWFRANWERLIYRDVKTMLLHPKRLLFRETYRALGRAVRKNPQLYALSRYVKKFLKI